MPALAVASAVLAVRRPRRTPSAPGGVPYGSGPRRPLRAAGLTPVQWPGWQSIERAEAALGASLGR
ncbi:hypothetical protein ABZZ79_35475, partial [Streptomyces sp. NPDC006458]